MEWEKNQRSFLQSSSNIDHSHKKYQSAKIILYNKSKKGAVYLETHYMIYRHKKKKKSVGNEINSSKQGEAGSINQENRAQTQLLLP